MCGQTLGLPCFYWLPGAVGAVSISGSQRGQKSGKQPTEAENQELRFLHLFISSWLRVTEPVCLKLLTNKVQVTVSHRNAIIFTLSSCFAILTLRHLFQCKYFPGGYCLNEMQARFVLLNIHCHAIWKSQLGFTNWLFFRFTQGRIICEVCLSAVLLEQDFCIICELSHGETKRQICNKSAGKSCFSGDQSEISFI